MLTKDQRVLLENALDALDRVFDRELRVVDLKALLFATGRALGGTAFAAAFESPFGELEKLVRSQASQDQKRDLALRATDDLRKVIADALRSDATDNPKRRHSL